MKKFLLCLLTVMMMLGAFARVIVADDFDEMALTQSWGTKQQITAMDGEPYEYYVDENGKFSTMIRDDDITWLYVEFIDEFDSNLNPHYASYWFGLSNHIRMDGSRLFERGSRFSVRFLKSGDAEYERFWGQIGEEAGRRLNPRKSGFCVIEVVRPDGTSYTNLGDLAELFVSGDTLFYDLFDENTAHVYKLLPVSGMTCPEPGKYTVYLLNHLDVAYLMDRAGSWTGSVIAESNPLTLFFVGVVTGAAIGVVACFVVRKVRRKKDSEE
ncbi:MAG: hypothetical protein KBS76_04170 [Ruminococcus sp.]|nr:hypothetical protein [Candidatus Apopatosoma intestinale]